MFYSWHARINLEINSIMIVGGANNWNLDRAIEYHCLEQTKSKENDPNPKGTEKTRKLAQGILPLGDVRKVKLWRNTIFLTISKTTSKAQAEYISMRAIETLVQYHLYNRWLTHGR